MPIRIPKSFKLFGYTIKVEPVANLSQADYNYGTAKYSTNQILIQPSAEGFPRDRQDVEATYLYELVHWILHINSYHELKKDENFVERFSHALHQALTTSEGEILPPGDEGMFNPEDYRKQ